MKTKDIGKLRSKAREVGLTYEEFLALNPPKWAIDAIWENVRSDGRGGPLTPRLWDYCEAHDIASIRMPGYSR